MLTFLNAIPDESSSTPGPSSDWPVYARELSPHDVSVAIYGISDFTSLVTGGAYLVCPRRFRRVDITRHELVSLYLSP